MKIYFDNYERPQPAKLYLGSPNNKMLCVLNGIVEDSVWLTPRLNNNYELTFDVDKQILKEDGILIDSNGYEWIDIKMRVYVDSVGWFICDSPEVHNDGIREYKTVTAYSCDIEMLQHDIINLKINCGTTDSYEMLVEGNVDIIDEVEFAKEYITFYNPDNPELSLLDILLKVSGIYGWKIGYIDDTPKEYKYYEDGELKKKYVSLSKEKGTFTVEAQDLYSFLTQDVAQYFSCVFLFDIKHMVINVYRPENLGKNTNINIGFRNLQNSNDIVTNDSDLFTRYMVYGSEGLSIEYVNFGWRVIENLDHFLNEKYLSADLIKKYKLWMEDVEFYRPQYIEYTRLYNGQLETISELENRVPLDDCSTDWSTFTDTELVDAQEMYEAQLKGYEQFYVDENGDFDKNALDNSVDANEYYQIKDVILPSIQIEMDNRVLENEDDYEEYIKSYETDWDLYGLSELESKLEVYQNTVEVCQTKHYDMTYEEYKTLAETDTEKYSSHNEEYHTKMYNKYLTAEEQLDSNNTKSCQYAYNQRKQEVDNANSVLEEYDEKRKRIVTYVEKETWNHNSTTSTTVVEEDGTLNVVTQKIDIDNNVSVAEHDPYVSDEGVLSYDYDCYFSEQDLTDLSKLYIDGEYVNENMFLLSSDTAVTAVDEQLKLLSAAQDDLYIASHPQYVYSCSLDNFLSQYEYKNYTDNLELGDYIWLGVRDDQVVKLRLISLGYNPVLMNNQLEIEFSNMVKSRASRDDFSFLLGSATSRGKKTAAGSGDGYLSNEGVQLTPGLLNKLLSNATFKDCVCDIVESEVENNDYIFDYLQAELISTDTIVANSGIFNELEAKVAVIDALLAGDVAGEDGMFINLNATNAKIDEALIVKLLAGELAAVTINTNKLRLAAQEQDENGVWYDTGGLEIVGNTMQFRELQTVIDEETGEEVTKEVVRIQIGKDEKGKFSFVLYGEDGKGILIDKDGIHDSAIEDGLIKTDMIANNSITTNKLCENGIYEWEDEDGNKVFDVANMYYNGQGFGVEFESIKTELEKIPDDLETVYGMIELVGEQFFKNTRDVITPDSITITAQCRNGAQVGYWEIDGEVNTEFVSDNNLTITIPSSFIVDKEQITIKVVDDTENMYDEITVYHIKALEGVQGEAAYTVILQNESVSFVVDYDDNTCIDDNTYNCGVLVFKGTEQRTDFIIGELISSNGVEVTLDDDNTIIISAQEGTEITATSGIITVPILIDGIELSKNINWNRISTGKPGQGITILGAYDSEEALRKAHPTGNPGDAYMVGEYLYVWDVDTGDWKNAGMLRGEPVYNVVLSNESQSIPCTNAGLVLDSINLTLEFDAYKGLERVPCTAAIQYDSLSDKKLPTGMLLGIHEDSVINDEGICNSGKFVFTVDKDSNLDGFITGDIVIAFTIEEQIIKKTFTWSKVLAGENGEITLYQLDVSDSRLEKVLTYNEKTGACTSEIKPESMDFMAFVKDSAIDEIQPYIGDFVIYESENNGAFTQKMYTQNTSTVTYSPSNNNVSSIKCYLYKAGTTKELDRVTIPILSNSESWQNTITQTITTMSGVKTTVDNVNKAITDEVWRRTNITTDDGEVVQLESLLVRDNKDLNGIKQSVEEIVTNFSDENGELLSKETLIDQTKDSVLLEASKTYITSNDVKKQLSEKNTIFQKQPTPPYILGDLWFKEDTSTESSTGNVIYECITSKGHTDTGTIFTTKETEENPTITPPYNVGDIWQKAVYKVSGSNKTVEIECYKCINSRSASDSFNASDWTLEKFSENDWRHATDYQTSGQVAAAIKVSADEIIAKVTGSDGGYAALEMEINKLKTEVFDPDNDEMSRIDQQADKISIVIGKDGIVDEEGDVNREKIVTSINADENGVKIKGTTIELESITPGLKTTLSAGEDGFITKSEADKSYTTIKQVEDSISLVAGTKKDNVPPIRYIRDWLWGTKDRENKNRWVKCLAYQESVDKTSNNKVTLGIIDENGLLDKSYDLSAYVDSTIEFNYNNSSTYIDLNLNATDTNQIRQAIQVDLGQAYPITTLYIEHYNDYVIEVENEGTDEEYERTVFVERTFNHKLEVSEDGETWFTLYDSDVNGGYVENGNGKNYYPSDYAIYSAVSSLNVSVNEITARVQDTENKYAELKIASDEISTTVKGTYDEEGNSNNDGLVQKVSNITQRSDQWEANFAIAGLNSTNADVSNATAITMDINGITVAQKSQNEDGEYVKDGRSVVIDVEGFHGYSADGKEIFTFENDLTITERILVNNGVDFGQSMKYINRDYTYINSAGNTVIVPCLVHVVTGGSS